VANIDRRTLIACVGDLGKHLAQGGKLLLSGLQEDDCDNLSRVVEESGGRVVEKRQRDEWLALALSFDAEREKNTAGDL
jgi:ribosomal protein L11 methylase PrmA